MSKGIIIYETLTKWDSLFIKRYIKKGIPVWIVEPFLAYHHKKNMKFFPSHFPSFVDNLIQSGKISVLSADKVNAKEIYSMSADKAVEVVETVYSVYREEFEVLFQYVTDTLKSSKVENVFKKKLCERLAEFYSVNIMLHRIEKLLGPGSISIYSDANVRSYFYLKALLSRSNQEFFEHPNIRFSIRTRVTAFFENLKEYLIIMARLHAQTVASGLLYGSCTSREKEKKSFSYGVTIISPIRQLTDNQRGPDFIIDNDKILPEDVVYLPLVDLTSDQKKQLSGKPGTIYYPPKAGQCFSNFAEWKKVLMLAFKENLLRNGEEISAACNVFFNYFKWLKILDNVKFQHFITHCDFGIGHVGRNIALNQAGVQTWYFTDSMNFGINFQEDEKGCNMRHPFWTYLNYDHFVTWNDFLARYFKDHPESFKQVHVVGCLWSEHILEKNKVREQTIGVTPKDMDGLYVLSCFDSTYSRSGFAPYASGIAFGMHLLQLVNEFPDIFVLLKEKKDRNLHFTLDPIFGPKLLDLYNKMDTHPRITICPDQVDATELISVSNMLISFPFTSTTFEALSVNKPAIWHDPVGRYRKTPYGKIGGVITHSYEELKTMVLKFNKINPGDYQNPIPKSSPLMDPYMDGKAIDRFRELLCSEVGNLRQ